MKLMIASDLHGSAWGCGALMTAMEREAADRLLLLGDLLYHGPRNALPRDYDPPRVAELLNAAADRLLCVRGNCDADVDQMVLQFPILAEYAVLELDGKILYAAHGHNACADALPPLRPGTLFLQGHTHVPMCEVRGGILCLNPGSVSIPKDGSPNSYMTLDGGVLRWKKLDGSVYREHRL